MKISLTPFFLGVLFLFVSCSTNPKGPFFWTVEREDQTLHILGTVHIGVGLEDLPCSQVISESLEQSELLWTEANVQKQRREIHDAAVQLLEDPSGQSFQSLDEKSQDFFKTKLQPEAFEAVKQMSYFGLVIQMNFLCIADHRRFLSRKIALHARKIKGLKRLDIQIQQTAPSNVPQDYLDESSYFGHLIRSRAEQISKKQVEKAVENYYRNCSRRRLAQGIEWQFDAISEAIRQYESGLDVDFLNIDEETLRRRGLSEDRVRSYLDYFKHNILRRRNEMWLDKVLSSQENNTSVFIAAGFSHFQGPFNMLDMLQAEGFSIKRLNPDCETE